VPPDKEPKATEYIAKMIAFIEALIKTGCAYAAGGDVYFDIKKAKGYGKLSNQSIDKMEIGARIAPGELKRDGLDFALWKAAKEDEPSWPSPWGNGRPGWHIECSAMSSDILGSEFDIHGGGIDLIFPHHENEIAQSEGVGDKFARFWMHNGLLTISGEKMAKSAGNFVTIKDFLSRYRDSDYLKLFFLSAHYRSPIDYTEEKIEEAKKEKERFLILLGKMDGMLREQSRENREQRNGKIEAFREKFEGAMDDDFNTPLALASLFDLVTHANTFIHSKDEFTQEELGSIAGMKRLLVDLSSVFGLELSKKVRVSPGLDKKEIAKLVAKRDEARKNKDFRTADRIRKDLSEKGVILEDTKDGTEWRIRV
jgi:cysteinyl-tRNA synthetase